MKYTSLALIILLLLFFSEVYVAQSSGEERKGKDVRRAAVAGMFYPSSPTGLRSDIVKLLDTVPDVKAEGKIIAALAPHAGYVFSGRVAAFTHKILSSAEFDTLVIIGHDTYSDAVAFTCPVDYYQTPLGKVPVDRKMTTKMHKFNRGIKPHRSLHAREHTIEVHLPFLKVLDRRCKIIPILFGNPTPENCKVLSDAIQAAAGNKKVLVLASTDMSHYPRYELANKIDKSTLEVLRFMDVEKLFAHLAKHETASSVPNLRTAMCAKGGVGTAILFAKAQGADQLQILHYANSGDVPAGDKDRVVGYCSALMVKTSAQAPK